MNFLPLEFAEFLKPNCNRFEYLKSWITKLEIPFTVLPIESKNHIFINFPKSCYSPLFKTKTLLVHYDRVENTPGANDNSAAVCQVLLWAKKIYNSPIVHNLRIIFTDGEELGCTKDQGAYGIASLYKKLGISQDEVFVLDGCGRGDILVVSTAGKNLKIKGNYQSAFEALYNKAISLATKTSPNKWITIPVPYGDNAGFIACGIPAVAITVLPAEEATVYMRQLQKEKTFSRTVLDRKVGTKFSEKAKNLIEKEKLPWTWRSMHTKYDDIPILSQEAFILMDRFLDNLADSKTMR
jgi:hypothetical protein